MFASTPHPPYYAVIFTAKKSSNDKGYHETAAKLLALVQDQSGFLGFENADGEAEITVSYWEDLASIAKWKKNADHALAQTRGAQNWYVKYKVRIARVEREY